MPLIGDELRTILGMMPTRDRAGIARGTMADDAVRSSAAADGGNAEGAALMQQGARPAPQAPPQIKLPPMGGPGGPPPGDIQLPDDVPTAYASGRGGSPAVPPAPSERVVAASPAAAPSREVATRASDVAMAVLAQQDRQQKMMQLVGSLGLIANAFNRNPSSQASTRSSLADMIGGGGGGKGSNDLAAIKTVSDMRDKEDAASAAAETRASQIGALQRRGLSAAEAALEVDSGKAGERIGAEADERLRARTSLENVKKKLRPKIAELAALDGSDPDILAGQLETDPSKVFELMTPETRAKVQKTLTDTEKTQFENLETGAHMKSWANARKDPEAFMKRFGITDPAKAAPMLDDFGAMRDFLKTSTPMHDELQRKVRDINAERAAKGDKPLTTEQVIQLQKETPAPEAEALKKGYENVGKQLSDAQEKAYANSGALTNTIDLSMRAWTPKLIAGSDLAPLQLRIRKGWSQITGVPDDPAVKTQVFLANQAGLTIDSVRNLPGALSEKELMFLKDWKGGQENDPKALYQMLLIQDKVTRARIIDYNERLAAAKADPKGAVAYEPYKPVPVPPPSHFAREAMKNNPALLQKLVTNKDNPTAIDKFNEQWGKGTAQWFIEHGS